MDQGGRTNIFQTRTALCAVEGARRVGSLRFRRPSYGRMEIDITIDDPKAYLKPFRCRRNQLLSPNEDLTEFVCPENNRFRR